MAVLPPIHAAEPPKAGPAAKAPPGPAAAVAPPTEAVGPPPAHGGAALLKGNPGGGCHMVLPAQRAGEMGNPVPCDTAGGCTAGSSL